MYMYAHYGLMDNMEPMTAEGWMPVTCTCSCLATSRHYALANPES